MKKLFKRFTARQLIIIGVTLPSLLLIFVDSLQWQSVKEYRAAREWVTHTRIVLLHLEVFLSCVNDAETGQRGYLLTHRESYLEPYTKAADRWQTELTDLHNLLRSDSMKDLQGQLEPLAKTKFDELAETIALEKAGNHEGAMKIVLNDSGKQTMDQIRLTLLKMHTTERAFLLEREATYQDKAQRNAQLSVLLIVVGLLLVAGIFLLVRRLERMQEMVKICAWSKLIEYEGEWLSIEEYLSRRFRAQITHGMSEVEAKKMLKLIEEEKHEAEAA